MGPYLGGQIEFDIQLVCQLENSTTLEHLLRPRWQQTTTRHIPGSTARSTGSTSAKYPGLPGYYQSLVAY